MLTADDVRRLTHVLVVLWILGLTGGTFLRAQAWTSDLTLWTAAIAVTPQKPRPWINVGLAREAQGDIPGAFAAQQQAFALAFQPRLTRYQQVFTQLASLTNIARLLAQHDQEGAAEQLLTQIVQLAPQFPHAAYNLAVLYAKTGRCAQGIPFATRAHQLDASFQVLTCP